MLKEFIAALVPTRHCKNMSAVKTDGRRARIEVSEAARSAITYFHKLFSGVKNPSLEEVELSEDGKFWMITLGYQTSTTKLDPERYFNPPKTKFKVFKVNARTGEVVAMKIRSLS